jgi:hypothetical protein
MTYTMSPAARLARSKGGVARMKKLGKKGRTELAKKANQASRFQSKY